MVLINCSKSFYFTLTMRHLFIILVLLSTTTYSHGAMFTVSNLNDSGMGSFRQAIIDANTSAGVDNIIFSVSGTITVLSTLPPITDPIDIDGTSVPGYTACSAPRISIDGTSAGSANGLQFFIGASGSLLQAINVRNFTLNGVQFIDADNCQVRACYIGCNSFGTLAAANGLNGIQIEASANNNLLGGLAACDGNLISGNSGFGVSINASIGSSISGNIIGLNATGSSSIANSSGGILAVAGSDGTIIGGSLLSQRNIISGNGSGVTGNGINLDGLSGSIIRGNFIGLNITGATGIGNAENGISLNGVLNNTIGGSGTNDGNTIADHNFHAIVLNNGSNNCTVQGNNIGTNSDGTVAIGNDDSGVIIINSTGGTIGGSGSGEGNILSGSLSEYGIFAISSSGLTIEGNFIGTDRTGTLNLGNFDGGIRFDFNAGASTIGGPAAGQSNIIAFNNGYGVGVLNSGSNQVLISRNMFYCNTGKGIDLAGVGNSNLASPVITAASTAGVSGTAGNNQTIELYYDSTCTATCQGKDFIASVTTSGPGNWSYAGPITNSPIAAIAISNLNDNTSEFTCFTMITGLPVEFGPFEGFESKDANSLSWITFSERNADYFVVKRSKDGFLWQEIGRKKAAGNSTQKNEYKLLDVTPPIGVNYYRLLQFDIDGQQSKHETIVQINNSAARDNKLIGIYNLLGKEIKASTKGIQIHRYYDGTTKRIVVE